MIDKIIVNGDIVYVITKVITNRSVNPETNRKALEVLIFGFNKKENPGLLNKIMKGVNQNVSRNMWKST